MRFQLALGLVVAGCLMNLGVMAHGPFDNSTRLVRHADRIELEVTMGKEGARKVLAGAGLSAAAGAGALKMRAPGVTFDLAPGVAASFFKLTAGDETLTASSANVLFDGVEAIFTLVYPLPETGALEAEAHYFEIVPEMRDGSLFVTTAEGQSLGGARLSRGMPTANFTLALPQSRETDLTPAASDHAPNLASVAAAPAATDQTAAVPALLSTAPLVTNVEHPIALSSNRAMAGAGVAMIVFLTIWLTVKLARTRRT